MDVIYCKTIALGRVPGDRFGYHTALPAEVMIELRRRPQGVELSMMGAIWKPRRDDWVSGGQIHDELSRAFSHTPRVQRMITVWRRWHLNAMNAGCVHQRLIAEQIGDIWVTAYGNDFRAAMCPVCGYSYGSAWLYEPLPQDIIEEVMSW